LVRVKRITIEQALPEKPERYEQKRGDCGLRFLWENFRLSKIGSIKPLGAVGGFFTLSLALARRHPGGM
jgi:hypothetical protein